MCRFACKNPSTCEIARFKISPVKESLINQNSSQFVRNQNVKFFSPSSDSESEEDEFQFPAAGQQFDKQKNSPAAFPAPFFESSAADLAILLPSSPRSPSSSYSSTDSGFVETLADDGKEEEKELDGTNSSTASRVEVGKSILMAPKGEREESGEKKKVQFADDCGHCLVRFRFIQSRRLEALYADFVEIGPIDEESNGNGHWKVALLRKLWAINTTTTNNNQPQSSMTTGEQIENIISQSD